MRGNRKRTEADRALLAAKRLRSVLTTYRVASMRTLENKISDAGPYDQRIDPHKLTEARNALEQSGDLIRDTRGGTPWYYLSTLDKHLVEARLSELVPLHERFEKIGKRLGQALEIAVWRALCEQSPFQAFMGNFPDIDAHDDSTLYVKEEPPSALNGRAIPGKLKLDFIAIHPAAGAVGVELKNTRPWLYPHEDYIRDLLLKCHSIDAVPVLIARRIHFAAFRVLSRCGVITHETFNQRLPESDKSTAEQASHKNLLGFHDIRLGNHPDDRLRKFLHENLAKALPTARKRFDHCRDLIGAYSTGGMTYEEFAARLRRREQGVPEDNDWPSELPS